MQLNNDDLVEVPIMLASSPRVVDAVWSAVEPLLPRRPATNHPLGCHRPRMPDQVCFEAILFRLVTGCSGASPFGSETNGEAPAMYDTRPPETRVPSPFTDTVTP